jgi:CO/xanthine dehydrogenase Mo-binding subunit
MKPAQYHESVEERAKQLRVVGRAVPSVDAPAKVTGRACFNVDLRFPGMLHAKAARSLHPHARLVKVDTSSARRHPGVVAVLTAADVPGLNRFGDYIADQPVLVAEGATVKMVGDPIALVVAETERAAAEAAELIEVEYEELTPIDDPEGALDPNAARVHPEHPGNLCGEPVIVEGGDLARGFAEADVVIEACYSTQRQEHAYMEPEAGVAVAEPDGGVTVYAGTQAPMQVRANLATAIGLPEHKVRIVPVTMGGAFGGKIDMSVHPGLALMALKTGRPVRWAWTSEESFVASPKRHPAVGRLRLGATRDGRITALEADWILDGGAYASQSPAVVRCTVGYTFGPYRIPNYRVQGRVAYTHNPISGGFRGFGGPQSAFAIESTMNKLAERLGIDPVGLRMRNILQQGEVPPWRALVMHTPVTVPRLLQRALELAGPAPRSAAGPLRVGRGLAVTMPVFDNSGGAVPLLKGTGLRLEVTGDGGAIVRFESAEYGEGVATALGQMTAEVLGIEPQDVSCVLGDTAAVPKSGRAVGSRQVYCLGNAMLAAAAQLQERLFLVAGERLEASPAALMLAERCVVVRAEPSRRVALGEVVQACRVRGINTEANAFYAASHAPLGHTFCAAVVDLAVDTETGKISILKTVSVLDVGRVINPGMLRGQMHGGEIQAMGFALMEDMRTEDGRLKTPTLVEYLIPTIMDIPEESTMDTLELPDPTGPFGAKGAGEHTTKDLAPAIVHGIHEAVGVWIDDLPATPERVWKAMQRAASQTPKPHKEREWSTSNLEV